MSDLSTVAALAGGDLTRLGGCWFGSTRARIVSVQSTVTALTGADLGRFSRSGGFGSAGTLGVTDLSAVATLTGTYLDCGGRDGGWFRSAGAFGVTDISAVATPTGDDLNRLYARLTHEILCRSGS